MASNPICLDEQQKVLDPERAKFLDDKIARADADEKHSVPPRPALQEDRQLKSHGPR